MRNPARWCRARLAVFLENAGPQAPDTCSFGSDDHGGEQGQADVSATDGRVDIHGVLDHAGIGGPLGGACHGDPAQDSSLAVVEGDQAVLVQLLGVEGLLGRAAVSKLALPSSIPAW
jgi:hypothetical protein